MHHYASAWRLRAYSGLVSCPADDVWFGVASMVCSRARERVPALTDASEHNNAASHWDSGRRVRHPRVSSVLRPLQVTRLFVRERALQIRRGGAANHTLNLRDRTPEDLYGRRIERETELDSGQMSLLVTAAAFAARKHKDQRRKDDAASPYINHPLALADVLVNEAGVNDLETIVAALLHDTIEDTETTAAEIEGAFGPRVRAIVEEVTDDGQLDKASRKQAQIDHAPQLSLPARAVKLADKICNLRDVVANPPAGWSLQRRRAYFDWAKQVIDGLRGSHPRLEALFDEAYARRP